MRRGGWLRRYTPLKAKSGVRKRAPLRAGMILAVQDAVRELARAVCMVRAGAIMLAIDGKKSRVPQWWGRCEWCKAEGWLQWCHIRSEGACKALSRDPLNTFAGCAACHHGRWHHKRRLEDLNPMTPAKDERREFLESIRTAQQIEYLMAPHEKRDQVLQAVTNFAALEQLTHGHAERAMWPEHFRTIVELIDRADLVQRLET